MTWDGEDGGWDPGTDAIVTEAAMDELAGGPLPLVELTTRLRATGVLPEGWETVDVDELLLETDDVWSSHDDVLARSDQMMDGLVLSHRVTASELERGVLDVLPDFAGMHFNRREPFELASGGRVAICYPDLDAVAEADRDGSFVGPDGWLAGVRPGTVVCLRRRGPTLALEMPSALGDGQVEVAALRLAFDTRFHKWGEEADALVLDALCRDPSLFRQPVRPLGELLVSCGLEGDRAWFGPAGTDWRTPGAGMQEQEAARRRRVFAFDDCCEAAYQAVVAAEDAYRTSATPPDLRAVAVALAHGSVAPAFDREVLAHEPAAEDTRFVDDLAGLPGARSAPGLYLRARAAERRGDTLVAERQLERAVAADRDFGPAAFDLAWYAADRGDALRAVVLFRLGGAGEDSAEVGLLKPFLPARVPGVGRNDPCPCGSGRKFKACCIDGATPPIERRAGWLYNKMLAYLMRPWRLWRVQDLLAEITAVAGEDAAPRVLPLLADAVAFEGDGVSDFVRERGPLLPDDEAALVSSWIGSRLGLWQVEEAVSGTSLTLRDTRSGERVTVPERRVSGAVEPDEYLLARVLPVGSGHQLFGMPLHVDLRLRASVIELLDSEPDEQDVAEWLARALSPPRISTMEGEDVVLCKAVLRPRGPWSEVGAALDALYMRVGEGEGEEGRSGTDDQDRWQDMATLADGGDVVRGNLRRQGADLVVEANSAERFERILDTLRSSVEGLAVVEEERTPIEKALEEALAKGGPDGTDAAEGPGPVGGKPPPAEMVEVVQAFIEQKEREWLDEEIPALGGMTPRQAAADPSRREDLVALLRDFDVAAGGAHEPASAEPASYGIGFDADRLRALLGLVDDEGSPSGRGSPEDGQPAG